MSDKTQLLGISNAIVDVLSNVEPEFLEKIGAQPGSMTLIDVERAKEIYSMMGPATENSGGSVANSIAGAANLGTQTAYIGRVAHDQLGEIFTHDMQSLGVDLRLPPETRHAPTARCQILITPDGERTLQTYLGACVEIAQTDITERTIGAPQIILLEGYVWDTPEGPAAMREAVRLGKAAGSKIALSLSDSECVKRHFDAFKLLLETDADIIIGNEAEALALFSTDDFDDVVAQASANTRLFVLTRSAKGSVIVHGEDIVSQPADAVSKVVDSTGAGDAYIAGFLHAHLAGEHYAACAKLATRCATAVIGQVGARLELSALKSVD